VRSYSEILKERKRKKIRKEGRKEGWMKAS
jgi:hypothetical protein